MSVAVSNYCLKFFESIGELNQCTLNKILGGEKQFSLTYVLLPQLKSLLITQPK